jgi:hypothetical protein
MTLKEEFLILWIVCLVVITFATRHFFGGLVFLVEKLAAFSIVCMPGLLHLLVGHLR